MFKFKKRPLNQYFLFGIFIILYIIIYWCYFLYRPEINISYKGIYLSRYLIFLLSPLSILLLISAFQFKKNLLRIITIISSIPMVSIITITFLFEIYSIPKTLFYGDTTNKSYELLDSILYNNNKINIYRNKPMAFDPYFITIEQEYQYNTNIKLVRNLDFIYRCQYAELELDGKRNILNITSCRDTITTIKIYDLKSLYIEEKTLKYLLDTLY